MPVIRPEVIKALGEDKLTHEEEVAGSDAISTHVTDVEEFQALTAPLISHINDEEINADDASVTQFVDETQADGFLAARTSSNLRSVTVVPKRNARFSDQTFLERASNHHI